MGTLYKHIEEHAKGGAERNNIFRSIFGTSSMNGAIILAKSSDELRKLTKRTEEAGKTGDYVAKLAQKNMATYQGNAARAKQATQDFEIALGTRMLPAMTAAQNELSKFLLSKDGKQFEQNVGGAVSNVTKAIINLIRFTETHPTATKAIGMTIFGSWTAYKGVQFLSFLDKAHKKYGEIIADSPKLSKATKAISGFFKATGKGANPKNVDSGIKGLLKYKSWGNMTRAQKLTFTADVAFNGYQIGKDFYSAITSSDVNTKYSKYGAGIGGLVGGAIGYGLGGQAGMMIGSQLGQKIGSSAASSFIKAFNYSKDLKPHVPITYIVNGKERDVQSYDGNGYWYRNNKGILNYKDQRNKSEKAWNTSHQMDDSTFLHPKKFTDLVAGAFSTTWQSLTHIGDSGFWKRHRADNKYNLEHSWLWAGNGFFAKGLASMFSPKAFDRYHGLEGRSSNDDTNALLKNIGNWWNGQTKGLSKQFKPLANTKIDWGFLDPKQNGLASFFKGFRPQVHGKKPKSWFLQADSVLPKVNGKKWASGIVKDAQKGFKDFPKFTRDLGGKSSKWFKSKWKGMTTWGTKTKKDAQHGFKGFEKWSGQLSGTANKWFESKWKGMKTWASGIHKNVRAGWNGFKKWLGNLGTDAVNLFKKPFEGLSKWVSDHIPKPVKAVLGGIGKGISWAKSKLTGKAHATGGKIIATHGALVGEAGPELAYKPYAKRVRLLGANGPEFTKVRSGEHILNARDTAKVLSGGLGAGTTLKGYASGTDKLKKTSKSVTDDYKAIASKSTKSLKKLTRSNKQAFKQVNTDANKQTKQTKTRTVENFKQMHHGITKQMDAIHDGVIRSGKSTAKGFGGAMDKMHKYAHSAMADTTSQLNKGISSIDKVLGQFGGNNSVIKPIKFAKGTDQQGRLTHNTLAMVNDATHGPRQEALVSPDNKLYLPKGKNVQLMLPAGWGVLNGTQTKQVTNKTINHFAKGTGISHSALRKLAEKANDDPTKWFKNTYSDSIKQRGPALNKGTIALGSNSSTKYGNPWSNALWGVINKQIDSDDGGSINATGLLKAAERYGEGHRYVWGATGPSTFDCSGLVMYTLKKAYGINYPHFSGSQYNMTRHISKAQAHMGDLVFWGAGGSDHVGIYAGGNKYFSAESPSQGIHMNTLDSVVGKGRPLFGRIKGMPSQKAKPKHQQKADSRLVALVKRELGSHALKWIKDNLGEDFGSLGSFSVGSDLKERARALAGGLKKLDPRATKAGIAAVLGNWNFESGGLNPSAVNASGGASGLGQWLGGRLTNLKAYARRHGTSWKNAGTQLSFAVKGEGSDSAIFRSILEGHGSVASLANRFSAEWERGGYNAQHVRGAMQVAKALGFAKGGRPKVGQNVIVGEHGPEIARFDSPVQIYSNEKSRRSLNLGKLPDVQHASSKKHFSGKFAPVININFNGSASDFDSKQARKIAEIVQRELEKVFNSIDEEFC